MTQIKYTLEKSTPKAVLDGDYENVMAGLGYLLATFARNVAEPNMSQASFLCDAVLECACAIARYQFDDMLGFELIDAETQESLSPTVAADADCSNRQDKN